MRSITSEVTQELPPIAMLAGERDRLRQLAHAALDQLPAAEFLAQEVERAEIVEETQKREDLVTMGSQLEFRDEVTGQVRRVTLVYPHEADVLSGRISVLTPIGAALIGLSAGQSIEWQLPSGGYKALTVLRVSPPT